MSSILVAHSNGEYAKKIATVLRSGGLNVNFVCTSGAQVLRFTNRHYQGGVIVCSEKLTDMPAQNLPQAAGTAYDFLFLLKSPPADPAPSLPFLRLILPVKRMRLISSVNLLLDLSGGGSLSVKKKIDRGGFDEKAVIESAKSLLMEQNGFSEPQAHRFIQKKSMDTGKKMIETALIILNE